MGIYTHELQEQDHCDLLELLFDLRGRAILSGYDNPLYRHYLDPWCQRVEYVVTRNMGSTATGAAKLRATEVLWLVGYTKRRFRIQNDRSNIIRRVYRAD